MQTINVPASLEGAKKATVRRWFKKPGDPIAAGEAFVELELEDRLVHLEAKQNGRLIDTLQPAGKTLALGTAIATFDLLNAKRQDTGPVEHHGVFPVARPGFITPAPEPAAATPSAPATPKKTGGPVIPILMPQAGNSMEEGTILAWKVKPGDMIKVGQVLYEVETDKASVEVEATDAGRLARILHEVGAVVPVKQPVAILADNDADADAFIATLGGAVAASAPAAPAAASTADATVSNAAAPTAPASLTDSGRVKASPAARKIAEEKGLDLAAVGAGSGPGGRILSSDLVNVSSAPKPAAPKPATGGATGARRPMSKMRKAIATNLQTSKQTVPHFYLRVTVNADPMFAFYRAQKPATGCTLNDVVLLAVGKAVGEFPGFRSRVDGNDIVESPTANIGVAVGLDDGLVVPVIMAIDQMTLAQLAPESKRIIEGARVGKLENVGKGVFTISNMGMFGVEEFSAIINPPESGILAVGAVRETVLVKDGAMKPGKVMTMTLSVDHRVVDGALAAKFAARLKELLEAPEKLA